MAADEEIRSVLQKRFLCPGIVIAGITSGVGHVDLDTLAVPQEIGRQGAAQRTPVDVAVHSTDGLEFLKSIQHIERPEVSRMPYFITLSEVCKHGLV